MNMTDIGPYVLCETAARTKHFILITVTTLILRSGS